MNLAEQIRAEGVEVREHTNWQTHAAPLPSYVEAFDPIGVLNHWDAMTAFDLSVYRTSPRLNHQPIYHVVIDKRGVAHLISQGYVYGAGGGDADVYRAMLRDEEPPPARVEKSMNGNPYFYAVCLNYHPGHDGAISDTQMDALIRVNAALCRRHGWGPYRINDHAGWTTRKWDIEAGGYSNDEVRTVVSELLGDNEMTTVPRDAKADDGLGTLEGVFEDARRRGYATKHTQAGGVAFNDETLALLDRMGLFGIADKVAALEGEIADLEKALANAGSGDCENCVKRGEQVTLK